MVRSFYSISPCCRTNLENTKSGEYRRGNCFAHSGMRVRVRYIVVCFRLHESLWQDKYQPDRKVSRETFMVALQNIQHILIRASESADFNKAV